MSKSVIFAAAVASATVLLSVPVNASEGDDAWREVTYSCESGQDLKVAFREAGGAVQVTAAERPTVKLVPRPAKSGFRYGDSRHELRGEGAAVTFKIGNKTPVKCTSQDPAALALAAVATR